MMLAIHQSKKRKVEEIDDDDVRVVEAEAEGEEEEEEPRFERGDVWYDDGSVIMLATGDIAFKVSSCSVEPGES